MMTNIIMSVMLTASSIAFLSLSPLQLGLCILMMAMMTAIMFATTFSTWMAFLIFLIYIGGMLIMFSYFIATSPNMKTSFMTMLTTMTIMTPSYMIILSLKPMNNSPNTLWSWMQNTTFYNMYHMPTLIMMALALLITLVIVVKISNTSKGPLRPFNMYV